MPGAYRIEWVRVPFPKVPGRIKPQKISTVFILFDSRDNRRKVSSVNFLGFGEQGGTVDYNGLIHCRYPVGCLVSSTYYR